MRSRYVSYFLVVLVLFTFIFTSAFQTIDQPSLRQDLLKLINNRREKLKLNNVRSNHVFQTAAQNHAEDMKKRNYFSSKTPAGTGPLERLQKVDKNFLGSVSQNIHKMTFRNKQQFLKQVDKNWSNNRNTFYFLKEKKQNIGIGLAPDPAKEVIYVVIKCGFTINNPKQYRKVLEEQLLKEVNNFRKQRDLSTLENDTYYEQAAQNHSKNMVELNFFSHRDPDGNSPLDRIQQIRSNYARSILENLARHSPTPLPGIAGEVLRGWENSPGHRENLLTENVRKSGFGISFDYDQNLILITHNFGNTHK